MLEALKIALICMIENLERQTLLFSSSVPYYILSDCAVFVCVRLHTLYVRPLSLVTIIRTVILVSVLHIKNNYN